MKGSCDNYVRALADLEESKTIDLFTNRLILILQLIIWRYLIGKIKCYCGKCEITIFATKALGSFLCGCQDCRQAVKWAEFKGGQKGEDLQKSIYVPSDISNVKVKKV